MNVCFKFVFSSKWEQNWRFCSSILKISQSQMNRSDNFCQTTDIANIFFSCSNFIFFRFFPLGLLENLNDFPANVETAKKWVNFMSRCDWETAESTRRKIFITNPSDPCRSQFLYLLFHTATLTKYQRAFCKRASTTISHQLWADSSHAFAASKRRATMMMMHFVNNMFYKYLLLMFFCVTKWHQRRETWESIMRKKYIFGEAIIWFIRVSVHMFVHYFYATDCVHRFSRVSSRTL